MDFISPPYLTQQNSVTKIMGQVLLALLPAIGVYCWLMGPIIFVQLTLASVAALASEALMLKLRNKPLTLFLGDGSAVVTAWLIVLALPPLAPWWLIVTATLFAIVIAKHLYGGLGQNPFNPAMIAFAVCIVAFPAQMSHWPAPFAPHSFSELCAVVFNQAPRVDTMAGATPLDTLKTALKIAEEGTSVSTVLTNKTVFGHIAGHGWEWVGVAYLLGGLFLMRRKIINWRQPVAFLMGIMLLSTLLWAVDSHHFATPLFHLFSGGTLLGAFFIVTDPVSGSTTPKGQLIFGLSAGILAYLIRVFGAYPDGVAFSVLLLNLCVPLIDLYTQPPIFGMKGKA